MLMSSTTTLRSNASTYKSVRAMLRTWMKPGRGSSASPVFSTSTRPGQRLKTRMFGHGQPGVIDQNIQRAEARRRLAHERLGLFEAAYIEGIGEDARRAHAPVQLRGRLCEHVRAPRRDHDRLRAAVRQRGRERAPDPRAAARDDGDLFGQGLGLKCGH